jgi:DNA-binding NtrC family response regulator
MLTALSAHTSRPDVMLLDDQPLLLVALAAMMEDAGFSYVEAETSDQALAGLQLAPARVLIADVKLGPNSTMQDGRDVAALAMRLYPDLGVIYCSGDKLRLQQPMSARERTLRKPFTAEQLVRLVKQLLANDACLNEAAD